VLPRDGQYKPSLGVGQKPPQPPFGGWGQTGPLGPTASQEPVPLPGFGPKIGEVEPLGLHGEWPAVYESGQFIPLPLLDGKVMVPPVSPPTAMPLPPCWLLVLGSDRPVFCVAGGGAWFGVWALAGETWAPPTPATNVAPTTRANRLCRNSDPPCLVQNCVLIMASLLFACCIAGCFVRCSSTCTLERQGLARQLLDQHPAGYLGYR
jgi:hypothetical protein